MKNTKTKKIFSFLSSSDYRFESLCFHGLYNHLSDEEYLRRLFAVKNGYQLNLDDPQSFNEKIQWLKIHDRKNVYQTLVDKYEAKQYIASKIGSEYIIPTLGVWQTFSDIDFSILPESYVLKCTHDSGGVLLVNNDLNKEEEEKRFSRLLKRNYYYMYREWPYLNVTPRIIAEEYLREDNKKDLTDYKIHCFNGDPRVVLVCQNRFSQEGMTEDFFDISWNHYDVKRQNHPNAKKLPEKPSELSEMMTLAKNLCVDIPFLRVDFYIVKHRIFVGELTLYPASGLQKFIPESFDYEMGKWLKIT